MPPAVTNHSSARYRPDASRESVVEQSWQDSLRQAYRKPSEVLAALGLEAYANEVEDAPRFPFLVPREFVSKMRHGDFDDPLLRQVLPLKKETLPVPGFKPDPNDESRFHVQPGLLQKYAHRALMITTGGCAINCRYCFRRNYPYQQQAAGRARLANILDTLQDDSKINEVILSGGDPLTLSNSQLEELICSLGAIRHIRRLRIHSRLPVTIPRRLDDELQAILRDTHLDVALVIHANHANEIDEQVATALRGLHRAGVNLLNQSVLLKGINDNGDALVTLCEQLFGANVLPYYVHLLDRVSGSAHFAVPLAEARELELELTRRLPGYLVPKFVQELAGEPAKTTIHKL